MPSLAPVLAAAAEAALPSPTLTAERRASLAEAAAAVVASWPPLTEAQADTLSALFTGGAR